MTVSAISRLVTYVGNGATITFAVPYQFFEIEVYVDRVLKTFGADYTISQTSPGTIGDVVFTVAPVASASIAIVGATVQTQGTDYVDNDSAPAEVYESGLDRLTMAIQERTLASQQSLRASRFAQPIPELDFAGNPGAFVHVDGSGGVELAAPEVFLGPFADAAEASAISAASDAANAQAALAAFRMRYLGAATSNPSLDGNGDAVVAGAFYYNTTANELRFYNGAVWVAVQQASGGGSGGVTGADQVTFVPVGGLSATNAQAALAELDTEKLAVSAFMSAYTASDVLSKLLTVDGAGSGLDAATLAGNPLSAFQPAIPYVTVPNSRVVSAGGLATGGGNLSADRTITVMKASQAQAEAGADDTVAMTPLRTKDAIAALSSSLAQITRQTFLSSGSYNWTKPTSGIGPNALVFVQLWGGGGGGGCATAGVGGGGGGGGAYVEHWIRAANLGATVTVNVAAGGASNDSPGTAGNDGGDTSFAGIVAYGGGGGGTSATQGGGGGGALSRGSSTGNGGAPNGGVFNGAMTADAGGAAGSTAVNNGPQGASPGGAAVKGGGGGGGGNFNSGVGGNGGSSVYGGAGGGGGSDTGTGGTGGPSLYGGAGGNGSTNGGAPTAGQAPGGGGGGSEASSSGAGGVGRAIISVFP